MKHTPHKQLLKMTPEGGEHSQLNGEREGLGNMADILPLSSALGYDGCQVPALTVLHNDVQSGLRAGDDAVMVAHNVGVTELPQEIHLLN